MDDRSILEGLQAAARAHMDEMLRDGMTGTAAKADDKPLTLADLEEAYNKIKALGPFPRAIWVVDYEQAWDRIRVQLEAVCPPDPTAPAYLGYRIGDIPVYVWSSKDATPEERKRVPMHGWVPGVWIEMSDGNHMLLKDKPGEVGRA